MPDEVTAAPAKPAAPREGAVDRSHAGEPAPSFTVQDAKGTYVALSSFAGKPVLLNLWATWCAPCVKELPALDALAGTLGPQVTVLAVSQDQEGMAKVGPFLAQGGYKHLKPMLDTDAKISLGFKANLPTTIMFDSQGREVWRVAGGRDWTDAESRALVAEAR